MPRRECIWRSLHPIKNFITINDIVIRTTLLWIMMMAKHSHVVRGESYRHYDCDGSSLSIVLDFENPTSHLLSNNIHHNHCCRSATTILCCFFHARYRDLRVFQDVRIHDFILIPSCIVYTGAWCDDLRTSCSMLKCKLDICLPLLQTTAVLAQVIPANYKKSFLGFHLQRYPITSWDLYVQGEIRHSLIIEDLKHYHL